MRATDILLGLCLFAVYCLVLFTDHLFRPMPPDCASCGNEMFRTTALCATCHAHHLQCWECSCGVVIADKCRAHSRGPAQRIAGASDFLTKTLPTPQASLLAIIVFIGATRNPKTPRNLTPHPLWVFQKITSQRLFVPVQSLQQTVWYSRWRVTVQAKSVPNLLDQCFVSKGENVRLKNHSVPAAFNDFVHILSARSDLKESRSKDEIAREGAKLLHDGNDWSCSGPKAS